jgi:hypothetical protein
MRVPLDPVDDVDALLAAALDTEAETVLRDTWLASARACTCCKGFVYACGGVTCASLGVCYCTAGDMQDSLATSGSAGAAGARPGIQLPAEQDGDDAEADMVLRDTWVAASRNCACCQGFVHACSGVTCQSLGMCYCAAGDMQDSPSGTASMRPDSRLPSDVPSEPEGDLSEADLVLRDTWVAASRNCACCQGFVHACAGSTCKSLGICYCAASEEVDAASARS